MPRASYLAGRNRAIKGVALALALAIGMSFCEAGSASAQVSPDYTTWMRMGREAYTADDFVGAEAAFKSVLQAAQSPRQRATAHGLLALTAEKLNRIDDARRHVAEALREFPGEGRASEVRGRIGTGGVTPLPVAPGATRR